MSCEADPIGVGILPTWAALCTCYSRILQRCLVLTLTVTTSNSDADSCENIFSSCLPTYVKIYSHESASEWIMVTLLCGRDRPKLETAVHKPALSKFVLTPAYRSQLSGSTMYSSRSIFVRPSECRSHTKRRSRLVRRRAAAVGDEDIDETSQRISIL